MMFARRRGGRRLFCYGLALLTACTTACVVVVGSTAAAQNSERVTVYYTHEFLTLPLDEDFYFTVHIGGVRVTDEDLRGMTSGTLRVQFVATFPTSPVVENCPGEGNSNKIGVVVTFHGVSADAEAAASLTFTSAYGRGEAKVGGAWFVGEETIRIAMCRKLKL